MIDLHLVEMVFSAQFFDNIIKLPSFHQPEFLQGLFCVLPRTHGSQCSLDYYRKTRVNATVKPRAKKDDIDVIRSTA